MKKLARKSLGWLLGLGWVSIFVCGFLAYMVTSYDKDTKLVTDGLGRQLSDAPGLARIFLLGSDRWAGFGWFVGDYVIFWGFVALSVFAAKIWDRLDDHAA